MKRTLLAVAALSVAGCVGVEVDTKPALLTEAEKAGAATILSYELKDPGSAQFRNWEGFSTSAGDRVICVELNGKNSFGAYAGFTQRYLRIRGNKVLNTQTEFLAEVACDDARTNTLKIHQEG